MVNYTGLAKGSTMAEEQTEDARDEVSSALDMVREIIEAGKVGATPPGEAFKAPEASGTLRDGLPCPVHGTSIDGCTDAVTGALRDSAYRAERNAQAALALARTAAEASTSLAQVFGVRGPAREVTAAYMNTGRAYAMLASALVNEAAATVELIARAERAADAERAERDAGGEEDPS